VVDISNSTWEVILLLRRKAQKVTDRSILHTNILHLSTYEKTQLLVFVLNHFFLYFKA